MSWLFKREKGTTNPFLKLLNPLNTKLMVFLLSYFSTNSKKLHHLRKRALSFLIKDLKRHSNNSKTMIISFKLPTIKAEFASLWQWVFSTKDLCVWQKLSYQRLKTTPIWNLSRNNSIYFRLNPRSTTQSLRTGKMEELSRWWTRFTIS